jgi:hypothetical protein
MDCHRGLTAGHASFQAEFGGFLPQNRESLPSNPQADTIRNGEATFLFTRRNQRAVTPSGAGPFVKEDPDGDRYNQTRFQGNKL